MTRIETANQNTVPFPTDSLYADHLLNFPAQKGIDFEDIPVLGSLPGLLQSVWNNLGIDVRFMRNGAKMPENAHQFFPVGLAYSKSPGQLVVVNSRDIRKPKLNDAERLHFLSSLADFLGDVYRWQEAVRGYEDDLSANFTLCPCEPTLYSILKESAKLVDCCAAALYMLDSQQKTLKMRACWGLPEERLLEPAKPLHDSTADVEAILGQAVIINEDYLFEAWQVQEHFETAVCVPVMSQQMILGTLWLYSDRRRDFTDHELRMMEYIAGRLVAELEKAALLKIKSMPAALPSCGQSGQETG
ncbi:MAG: GAF domain-containing protein [Planctomycetaceae bacterium]|jgi:hypothetical protein|nr:GAF domain-containing protein [Planctomycetaceae bacterium]